MPSIILQRLVEDDVLTEIRELLGGLTPEGLARLKESVLNGKYTDGYVWVKETQQGDIYGLVTAASGDVGKEALLLRKRYIESHGLPTWRRVGREIALTPLEKYLAGSTGAKDFILYFL